MSILYCAIPHFATALARRDRPELRDRPLVLIGPGNRVFAASAESTAYGVVAGLTSRIAHIRCPGARLLDADVARCRQEFETFLQLLEHASPRVEAHGWGAAYIDLADLARDRAEAVTYCGEIGRSVRRELGDDLQPALGWDSSKFTAQVAARRTRPGHLLAVSAASERSFLKPLPVALLPLAEDALRRLGFLGLRTLGQYAALPPAAVWQQFGRAGRLAHRYARGEDDRPVLPRWQAPRLTADREFEVPLAEREHLLAVLKHLVAPLLAKVRGNLQTCGQVRLTVHFDDGSTQEKVRTFLFPTTEESLVTRALGQLSDEICQSATLAASPLPSKDECFYPAKTGITALSVTLEQIQDVVVEQLTLFSLLSGDTENERERKLRKVQRYLAARFGPSRLRRAALVQPGAPLPEWRIGWQTGEEL